DTRSRSGRRAREADRAKVVRESFKRVCLVKADRRTLGGSFIPQTEVVIDELPPHPAPLGHAVLREDVLANVVEDPIAHIADGSHAHSTKRPDAGAAALPFGR